MANRFNELLPGVKINPKVSQYVPQEYIPGDVYLGMPVDDLVQASNKLQEKFDIEKNQLNTLAENLNVKALDKANVFDNTILFEEDQKQRQMLLNAYKTELDTLTENIANGDVRDLGKVRTLAKKFANDPTRILLENRYAVAQEYFKELRKVENTPGQEYVRNKIDSVLANAAIDFSPIDPNASLLKGVDDQAITNKIFEGLGSIGGSGQQLVFDENTGTSMVIGRGSSSNIENLKGVRDRFVNDPELRRAAEERLFYQVKNKNPYAQIDPEMLKKAVDAEMHQRFVAEFNKRAKIDSSSTISNVDNNAGGARLEYKANNLVQWSDTDFTTNPSFTDTKGNFNFSTWVNTFQNLDSEVKKAAVRNLVENIEKDLNKPWAKAVNSLDFYKDLSYFEKEKVIELIANKKSDEFKAFADKKGWNVNQQSALVTKFENITEKTYKDQVTSDSVPFAVSNKSTKSLFEDINNILLTGKSGQAFRDEILKETKQDKVEIYKISAPVNVGNGKYVYKIADKISGKTFDVKAENIPNEIKEAVKNYGNLNQNFKEAANFVSKDSYGSLNTNLSFIIPGTETTIAGVPVTLTTQGNYIVQGVPNLSKTEAIALIAKIVQNNNK